MVQPASISRILPTLAGRPPTPPRDATEPKPGIFSRLFSKPSQPPDITPTSSSESPNNSEPFKKRVAWDDDNDKSALESSAVPVTVSGERKPIKSILKPYNGNSIHTNLGPKSKLSPPHTYANLAAMLESVAQQLAGKDRNSKMDAYTTLSGVLKASENVPDIRALKDKMGLLLQFIRRDLTAKSSTGTFDTTLVINALILLSIFLHRPAIAENLTTDFSIYLVDHAIRSFEDASMSKDVVKHLMLILAVQNFSAKIMNGDRVSRLVASLHDIEKNVKGKSIVMGRINIYRRLLRQSKAHMLVNTVWVHDLFGDMFSTVKETRALAVAFGLEAGLLLGTESKATRAFMELFSSDMDVGEIVVKFGEYYAGRLKAMIEAKQDISSVPQIWSVPILFLRSRPRQFEQWVFMKTWLGVIQECFNCSDHQAKFEANLAWNRLVFAIQPDEKTTSQMVTMLYQPLREQLRRKSRGRKAALGSLCNLLYYSLKPTSTYAQLDLYWDRYIVESVGKALAPRNTLTSTPESSRQDSMDACYILTALFDSTRPRPWTENRAMDSCSGKDTAMEPSELPALDSRWLRKSPGRVFPIMSPLLENLYWDLGEETETATGLWKSYITSIASPAVMEVKVSNETMSCVACIFGLMYKIWQGGPKSLQPESIPKRPLSEDFLSSFERIISTTIKGLGLLPFTEKLLSIGSEDEFVVIATPSHQPRKARGEPKCPLHHLFVLLTQVSPDLEYDRKFSQMLHRILSPFFDARPSKRGKLDLVQDLLGLLPPESNKPCRMIWSILADFTTFATDTRDESTNGANGTSGQPLGAEYRATLKILEFGFDLSPTEPLAGWKILFEALVASATIDAGDGGRALAVIEPLGRVLQTKLLKIDGQPNCFGSIYFRTLLSKATYPKDRQALDAARRRLWGTAVAKTSSFDPYNHLYEYTRESLQKAYKSFCNGLVLEYSDMISATTSLLAHCPASLLINALVKLQSGIGNWIKDESSRIVGGNALAQSITSLWSKICQIIPNVARSSNHSKLLADLENLICSGLESRHRAIVNASIRVWNSTFGASKEHLAYPLGIKNALLRLRLVAELQLPFFPESLESDGVVDQRQLQIFTDTQDNSTFFGSTGVDSVLRVQPTPQLGISSTSASRLRSHTPQVVIEVAKYLPLKRSRESTPDPKNRKSRKRNVAPKLRHDDSQIQFQAIESSPIADAVLDSQLLTDRQKEVKERQEAEAAMFPDLRSSPIYREKSRPSSSSELPLHRSASKSRAITSPIFEQQTTPTLVPQAEYDDYVNSSPTPTRALSEECNLLDVPSSPPDAVQELPVAYIPNETDIPSSPPEMPLENEHGTTTSLDPSAQIDPYAYGNIPTLSFVGSTANQQNGTAILRPAVEAEDPKPAVVDETSITEAEMNQPIPEPGPTEIEEPRMGAPDTPIYGRETSPATFQTPRSEIFHDSQTSPASSDKNTVNEDVFVDAFSSPRLNLDNARKQPTSSPLSYLDESSALRLMEGYDQGSGRPMRSVRFSTNKENQSEQASPTSSKVLFPPAATTDGPSDTIPDGLESLLESQATGEAVDKERTLPVEAAEGSSPMPSLIPETPGPKAALNLQIVDGEEIDLDETIIVDDSILKEREPSVPKRPGRKRKSDTSADVATCSDKKVKHEEIAPESAEVNGSQEAKPEIFSPKKKTSPKKRKTGRGRHKSSPVSFLTETGSEPSSSPSFSVDHVGSAQVSQEMETATEGLGRSSSTNEVIILGANGTVVEDRVEVPRTVEGLVPPNEELRVMGGQGEEERHDTGMEKTSSAPINNDQNISDVEMVADTILGESSSLEKRSSAPGKLDNEAQQEAAMSASKIITMSLEPMEQVLPVQADASMQTEVVVEAPSVQGLKDRLQGIIGDLGTVALSRDEMNDLEDMFMDAKQQLYSAARRSRARS